MWSRSTPAALPVFNHAACTCSQWCVVVCPTDCLTLWNDRPWLARPNHCVDCGACVLVCPTNAIELVGPADGFTPAVAPPV
ncbi:MAG: ATP-binding protein [Planctomycetia bacterium]